MFYTMILCSSAILTILFTQMTHPLAMGLMLLIQTVAICLITGLTTQSFWFSYILFLVFLGGLLVLFIYVTSLASNEMFSLSISSLLYFVIPFVTALLIIMITDPNLWLNGLSIYEMTLTKQTPLQIEEATLSLMKIYNNPTNIITLMLVLYLFLTLIVVVKITKISHGPLRPKN
uniref:NADH-ubiquinone oxidoreductase chain 6 n=1 Tax=Perlesta teaysia TaxID=2570576 RepID=A0A890CIQ1_9NEOP|nr:NADH dehydrogenase subunit 6 [Perlesta teaysia]QRG31749.1 NADH dehydrogenase subunit 6 [Perlesta teaysia]